MTKPIIRKFSQLAQLMIQKYERYLPTAFDESLTLLEKVNKIIEYLNQTGLLVNEVVEQWNEVVEWVIDEGLIDSMNNALDEMYQDGRLSQLINVQMIGSLSDLDTEFSEHLVGAINEIYNNLITVNNNMNDSLENITNTLNNELENINNTLNDELENINSTLNEIDVEIFNLGTTLFIRGESNE